MTNMPGNAGMPSTFLAYRRKVNSSTGTEIGKSISWLPSKEKYVFSIILHTFLNPTRKMLGRICFCNEIPEQESPQGSKSKARNKFEVFFFSWLRS